MNINKKIIGLILISFLFVATVFTYNSFLALKKSQTDNLNLFKSEFLELARESFKNNSYQFFYNLDSQIQDNRSRENILEAIKKSDNTSLETIIIDTSSKTFLSDYSSKSLVNIYTKQVMDYFIEKSLQENILNQVTDFEIDNFKEFSLDTTNTVIPKKIRFHVYNDSDLMVGVGEEFLSAKIRLSFIERQNQESFKNQVYYSLVLFSIVFILTVIVLIIFLRKVLLKPLNKIVAVVSLITGGDLDKQIEVTSKDEIGRLGNAFNEMTTRLKNSYSVLEQKIAERTKELQEERGSLEKKVEERTRELEGLKDSLEKTVAERTNNLNSKVLELERMNDLMVGRELRMAELKEEIKKLKNKK